MKVIKFNGWLKPPSRSLNLRVSQARSKQGDYALNPLPSALNRPCLNDCPYGDPKCVMIKKYKVYAGEGALHGEYIGDILKVFKQGDSSCLLLALLDTESRWIKIEELAHLREQVGEYSSFFGYLRVVTSIHEDVLLSRMTMQITK